VTLCCDLLLNVIEFRSPEISPDKELILQIKTRVAGVLATSAAAIAIMGGPAFA
jgi:hypothetical protein